MEKIGLNMPFFEAYGMAVQNNHKKIHILLISGDNGPPNFY
jgi:vancomycin permeability regulator SanA